MLSELKRGVLFTVATMLLFGGAYHALMWGIASIVFPHQAGGSLIQRADGTVVGSSLIAQKTTRPEYFQPRPSAVDYNASSTGGSNHGPSAPDHLTTVRERLDALVTQESVAAAPVPSEMVTASGAGLDPHIPPSAAEIQVGRVARARAVNPERVREFVVANTQAPVLGVLGRARVNVLELNLALDKQLGRVHH